MSGIMNNNAEVAVFLGLTALIWGDWYAPTVSIWADYQLFKLWRNQLKRKVWLPPMVFFAVVIVLTYGFIQASLYTFYRNVFTSGDSDWMPTAITLLFLFFLMFTKRWLSVYMIGGRTLYALLLLLCATGTSGALMGLYGAHGHMRELYFMIPYMLFLVGAFYLNLRTGYIEYHYGFVSEIPREKWYKNVAAYDIPSTATPTK